MRSNDKAQALAGKRIVVTGGTGSLGQVLVHRLLDGELGVPEEVVVFSRDEAKQHWMRVALEARPEQTHGTARESNRARYRFRIGDITDFHSVAGVLKDADVVFNVAALKQVPSCEYAPMEAVRTNVHGPENIVRAIRDLSLAVETVVFISTDKACKPVNVMGMTKAIQERVFIQANLEAPATRFVGVRYGNVLGSRGSVIPVFRNQIAGGGPVTITTPGMTRFLVSLERAVDISFAATREARPGEIYVPRSPAARIVDIARVLIGERRIETAFVGSRPGEKVHETLISEEEAVRTVDRNEFFAILPGLSELRRPDAGEPFTDVEYTSDNELLDIEGVADLIRTHRLLVEDEPSAP